MKILNQISQWVNHVFHNHDGYPKIHSVYNCRDILMISPIGSNRFSPSEVEYTFNVHFTLGNLVLTCSTTNDYQSLYNLRELFINNIGFSYLQLTESDVEKITLKPTYYD